MGRFVDLTDAKDSRPILVRAGSCATIREGPHGGAVLTVGGERIGVKETPAEVRRRLSASE